MPNFDQFGSFAIVFILMGGVITWLLVDRTALKKEFKDVIDKKDLQIEKERERNQKLNQDSRDSEVANAILHNKYSEILNRIYENTRSQGGRN